MDSAASAIPDQRTVALINTYIVRTAATLNGFSASCEETLTQVHVSLDEADTRLQLLEYQLAALPDGTAEADKGSAAGDSACSDPLGAEAADRAPDGYAPKSNVRSCSSDSQASDAVYHEAEADLAPEARTASQQSSASTPESPQTLRQAALPQPSARQQTPANPPEDSQVTSLD